jgi:hypothetical protein
MASPRDDADKTRELYQRNGAAAHATDDELQDTGTERGMRAAALFHSFVTSSVAGRAPSWLRAISGDAFEQRAQLRGLTLVERGE